MNLLALGFFILCLLLSPQLSAAATLNAFLQLLVFLILAHIPALVNFYISLLTELWYSDIADSSGNYWLLFSDVGTFCIDVECGLMAKKNLLIELR